MGKRKRRTRQEEKVKALEAALQQVRAELATAVLGVFKTMRAARRCPACGGGRLLHIPAAKELTKGRSTPLTVHHVEGFWGAKSYGPIEHFICRGCLLIESHAIDLDGVEPDGESVIAIEPEPEPEMPSGGPFR
ncbi:MAG: hypothetical protein H0T46_11750 [Deltaproteobacteria bacterium]|nr:hypothetical protein [Deltaproteobacteria bacterium]